MGTSRTCSRCAAMSRLAPASPSSCMRSGEAAARPKDRVALPVLVHGHNDGLRRRRERIEQPIEMLRSDARHVAEQDQGAVAVARHGADAGPERAGEPRRVVGIGDQRHVEAHRLAIGRRSFQCRGHTGRHMAGHDQHRPRLAGEGRPQPPGAPSACRRDRPAACSALPCGSSGRRRARWRRCGPRPARLARCCWPTSRPSSRLRGAEMPFAHQLRQWHPVVGLLAGSQRLGQERLVAAGGRWQWQPRRGSRRARPARPLPAPCRSRPCRGRPSRTGAPAGPGCTRRRRRQANGSRTAPPSRRRAAAPSPSTPG